MHLTNYSVNKHAACSGARGLDGDGMKNSEIPGTSSTVVLSKACFSGSILFRCCLGSQTEVTHVFQDKLKQATASKYLLKYPVGATDHPLFKPLWSISFQLLWCWGAARASRAKATSKTWIAGRRVRKAVKPRRVVARRAFAVIGEEGSGRHSVSTCFYCMFKVLHHYSIIFAPHQLGNRQKIWRVKVKRPFDGKRMGRWKSIHLTYAF